MSSRNSSRLDKFTSKMIVIFNVLCLFMEYRVGSNMQRNLIVTQYNHIGS